MVFNVSSLRAFVGAALICGIARGETVVYLRGGSIVSELQRSRIPFRVRHWLVRVPDQIFATNEQLLTAIGARDTGRQVSPFVPPQRLEGNPHKAGAIVFAYNGSPLYNLPMAVRAVEEARRRGRADLKLTVVLYGPDGPARAATLSSLVPADWLTVLEDLGPEEVHDLVARSEILLRPTTTDGDSNVVRLALHLGTRCIASSIVPRPRGCELAPLDSSGIADAILGVGNSVGHPPLGDQLIGDVLISMLQGGEPGSSGAKL